jgi:uncharacterized protein (DUF849 family)
MLTKLRPATGCRFEYEAYDVGHLYTLAYYHQLGLVEPPIFLQTIMGVMGGIGGDRSGRLIVICCTLASFIAWCGLR